MRGVYPNLEPRRGQPMGGKCEWQLRGMTPPKKRVVYIVGLDKRYGRY